MKLFHLYRREDESGVSGTGPVVEGVEFTNGWCAMRWLSDQSSVCLYQSLRDIRNIHSHGGKTEIVVHDFVPLRSDEARERVAKPEFELFLRLLEQLSQVIHQSEAGELDAAAVRARFAHLHRLLDRIERRMRTGAA
jgi:hypothetical protein